MIFIFENIMNTYDYYMYSLGDPRTSDWFLVRSPLQILLLLALYLHVCLLAGPKFMKKRQPHDLKNATKLYNVIQILLNLHVFKEMVAVMYLSSFDFRCQEVDYSTGSLATRVVDATWLYLIIKIIDLFDTVIPVFRKEVDEKFNLRVFYHLLAVITTFLIARFAPGGHSIFAEVLDCLVHIILYSHNLLSSLGNDYEQLLPSKTYLSQLQIAEFFIASLHNFQVLFRSCAFPKPIALLNIVNSMYKKFLN